MNNSDVQRLLDECDRELHLIKSLIDGLGITSAITPYLTKYTVVRACGTIEQAFKTVVADFCSKRSKKQVKRFLERRVRDSSMNPSYSRICQVLDDFDEDWKAKLKTSLDANADKTLLLTSLQSLVDARNEFAHGGNPSASIGDIIRYFIHSRTIIEALDQSVT